MVDLSSSFSVNELDIGSWIHLDPQTAQAPTGKKKNSDPPWNFGRKKVNQTFVRMTTQAGGGPRPVGAEVFFLGKSWRNLGYFWKKYNRITTETHR